MFDKYVGYIRVSTLSQVNRGHSLDFQKEAIKKYCRRNDIELVKIYVDRGKSAVKHRPQFEAMMKHVFNDDEISGVIVNDLTRFGRTTSELLTQIQLLDSRGKKFVSVKEKIDISSKTGRLILGMLALIADFERSTILERMAEGKEYAGVHGTRSGLPMHRPRKEIDFDTVRLLRGSGVSWNQIARVVGVSTPTVISRSVEEGIK